jgi:hypothetical protein
MIPDRTCLRKCGVAGDVSWIVDGLPARSHRHDQSLTLNSPLGKVIKATLGFSDCGPFGASRTRSLLRSRTDSDPAVQGDS